MILKYVEWLRSIFANISSEREFSFMDYLTSVGVSIGFTLMVVSIVLIITLVCTGPKIAYGKMFAKLKAKRDALVLEANKTDEMNMLNKKIRNRIILFAFGIVTIYVPVAIPTVLYLCYLLFYNFAGKTPNL